MKTIVVFRFSAMGDVAMTAPVLHQLAQAHNIRLIICSRGLFEPFFENLPNSEFFKADLKGKHKGLLGLFRLFRELRSLYKIDGVADLHGVLRTYVLGFYFRMAGVKTVSIDKERKQKKKWLLEKGEFSLKTSFERYKEVFQKLGFDFTLVNTCKNWVHATPIDKLKKSVGFAPFAKHRQKELPINISEKVIDDLTKRGYKVYMLGGVENADWVNNMESKYNVDTHILRLPFTDQVKAISNLETVVSMDSANMHIASLVGVPVVSVWGATLPSAGFLGYGQFIENAVKTATDLECQPCSIFGNKPCIRGDWKCLQSIESELIVNKIEKLVKK